MHDHRRLALILLATGLGTTPVTPQSADPSPQRTPYFSDDRQMPGFADAERRRLEIEAAAEARRQAEDEARRITEQTRPGLSPAAQPDTGADEAARRVEGTSRDDLKAKLAAEVEGRLAAEARDAKARAERETAERDERARQAAAPPTTPPPAAPAPVAPAPTPAAMIAPDCAREAPASVETAPQPGGRLTITIAAPCRAGQRITVRYGTYRFIERLDADGDLTTTLDLFLGPATTAVVEFEDGLRRVLPPLDAASENVTKVAIVWSGTVDFDLHAFEYGARRGEPGHRWSGATGSADEAGTQTDTAKRGHGFIGLADTGGAEGDHVEVYTFLHRKGEPRGVVRLAVDFVTRGSRPGGDTCGGGPLAQPRLEIVRLTKGTEITRSRLQFRAAPCDVEMDDATRYTSNGIDELRVGR
ncbi:MAG: hypothetical protein NW205_10175 [Hyphomicrobiaceae bacterium]|nr:hypothetical protein [Hyphomicrobiaceae bacterium]